MARAKCVILPRLTPASPRLIHAMWPQSLLCSSNSDPGITHVNSNSIQGIQRSWRPQQSPHRDYIARIAQGFFSRNWCIPPSRQVRLNVFERMRLTDDTPRCTAVVVHTDVAIFVLVLRLRQRRCRKRTFASPRRGTTLLTLLRTRGLAIEQQLVKV